MTYKANRGMLNQEKRVFEGVGLYDTPQMIPTQNKIENCEFIGFNFAKTYKNPSSGGVHFFVDDYQMERVWNRIDTYTKLMLKFKYVLSPDFSLYADFPKSLQIYNHFRKQYIARYWQEYGVNVIPSVNWSTPESYEFCFDGIPENVAVAICTNGTQNNPTSKKLFEMGYKEMMERLHPTEILVCGIMPDCLFGNVRHIDNFSQRRFEK